MRAFAKLGGRRLVLAMLTGTILLGGVGLLAQPAAQPGVQEEFVPVKDLARQEQLPGGPLVIAAYGFVWAVLLVYLWTIWRRLAKVESEMHDLAARIAVRDQGSGIRD